MSWLDTVKSLAPPQPDKLLHAMGSYALTITLALVFPLPVAALAALTVGALKEVYDHYHPPHSADWLDFAADAAGVALAAAAIAAAPLLTLLKGLA